MTEVQEVAAFLRQKAEEFRDLASIAEGELATMLRRAADDFEVRAARIEPSRR